MNRYKPIVAYPDGWIDGYPGFIEGIVKPGTISREGDSGSRI